MDKIIVEGNLVREAQHMGTDRLFVDGKLLTRLVEKLDFVGKDISSGGYFVDTYYGRVRITIERIEDE